MRPPAASLGPSDMCSFKRRAGYHGAGRCLQGLPTRQAKAEAHFEGFWWTSPRTGPDVWAGSTSSGLSNGVLNRWIPIQVIRKGLCVPASACIMDGDCFTQSPVRTWTKTGAMPCPRPFRCQARSYQSEALCSSQCSCTSQSLPPFPK